MTLSCPSPFGNTIIISDNSSGTLKYTGSTYIPAGGTTANFGFWSPQVLQSVTYTMTATLGTSQASTSVTVNPLVPSLSLSGGTLVGFSTQQATLTINLNGPLLGAEYIGLSLTPSNLLQFPVGNGQIQAGQTSTTLQVIANPVPQPTPVTIIPNYRGVNGPPVTVTVLPLIPSITVSPSSIVAGGVQTATAVITLNAPVRGAEYICPSYSFSSSFISVYADGYCQVPAGGTTTTLTNIRTYGAPSPYDVVTMTVSYRGGPSNSASLLVYPSGTSGTGENGSNLGPCDCTGTAGSPINLTSGNTWIQQHDYSLPGLGGGLDLTRTWNSQWRDTTPVSLAGMFGHSWRSTYEEQLNFPASNTVKYWRVDGSAVDLRLQQLDSNICDGFAPR